MTRERVSRSSALICVIALILGPVANPLLAQSTSVSGRMSGRVFDKDARTPVSGVTVTAQLVTTNEFFISQETDTLGNYLISDTPAGVYGFSLDHEGTQYPVEGRFDVRAAMSFLLESCFVLDRASETAMLRSDCASGLYAETQVVSLGPHRFFKPDLTPRGELSQMDAESQQYLDIVHTGLQCISSEYYPQLTAGFEPQDRFQLGRVYFRAAQHPNFYYVEFVNTGMGLEAILPKPAPGTTQIVYYVEGTDVEFNPSLSPEYTPDVTDHETCQRRDPEAAYFTGEAPAIAVGSTIAGAASVPPGFMATGITTFISASGTVTAATAAAVAGGSAGAGLGTTGLVIIIAGAAGAVSIIAVASTGEEEASEIR